MMVRPAVLRYSSAVASTGLATAARLALNPFLGGRHPFVTYYVAVLLTAWYGGIGPMILAVLLGALLADYFFIAPSHSSRIAADAALGPALFSALGLSVILVRKNARAARARLKRVVMQRDRAESGRRDEAERLRTTLDSIGDGVVVTDAGGRIATLNPVAERLLGWSSADAAGRPLGDVFRRVDEESGAEVGIPSPGALGEGSVLRLATTSLLIAGDGSARPIDDSIAPIRGAGGEITGLVIVFRDVSERRRAERAGQESEERLRLAHEAASMGHWDYDITTNRVTWSPGLEAMHGLAPGTFGGTFDAFLGDVHPEDRERVVRTIARTIEEKRDHHIEYRFLHPDGELRWVEGRGKLFHDDGGRPVRLIGVCMDVTERKRAEEATREADRRKVEFLATLAHELRNPLAPIRTGLEILKHTEGDNPAVEPLRAMMERQAEHLAYLINDLMDVARISRGTIELRKEIVGLASVVEGTVNAVRPLIDERGHELSVSLPDVDERLEADPIRLEQILSNLLTNAAKYTDPGGHIRLEARGEGGEIVISVKDTGIGIAPEVLTKVFDMFVQIERRLDRSQGGLGIGLGLVKSLVEMHGGRVSAHSEGPGKGSEFVVHLPAIAKEQGDRQGPPQRPGTEAIPGPPRRRVLVVDDNQDAADSLAKYLTKVVGQQVEVAYDGPEALGIARQFRPHIVLLDIGLPGMSGYDVAERLREEPETGNAMLIALTGWGHEEDRLRSKAAGIDAHLVKPVDLDIIRDMLANGLPHERRVRS